MTSQDDPSFHPEKTLEKTRMHKWVPIGLLTPYMAVLVCQHCALVIKTPILDSCDVDDMTTCDVGEMDA